MTTGTTSATAVTPHPRGCSSRGMGSASAGEARPPAVNYVVSFVLVGMAWGLTTPFMRQAARTHRPAAHAVLQRSAVRASRLRTRLLGGALAAADLLRKPGYALPLLLNLSGSVWFFLVGKAELSLTVPIVNTMAFVFTVLGEWYVEGKVISKDTAVGVLVSPFGIALCVHSKS